MSYPKLLIFIGLFPLFITRVHAYWIWTPKSGKWVNPKSVAKESPKEQFEFARSFFDEKNYDEAKREFLKLLKNYPKSAEAAESQYYLGLIEEAQGNLYEAYKNFQKVIDKYPFSPRIQEIIEHEFNIAEKFMAGEKRKALGITLPVENPAIEIYTKVIENSTYGPFAPKAQYKLGLVLKSLMRYYEAEEAFNKVITNYPNSEWVEASKYQIALCRQALSKGPEYDQGAAEEAKQKFEEFVQSHPDAILSREAEKNISELKEKEAEASFNIARFYEKQKEFAAAKIYYEEIINNNPDSGWAVKALERLQIIERKK
ncbi:MAG: outer membrane protein assembly factor BamD [Candidatus Omnitrophica bacterium]|nr:outer membrane protein assembly factor BamD [Candidatus Omnitrophota bacterium]